MIKRRKTKGMQKRVISLPIMGGDDHKQREFGSAAARTPQCYSSPTPTTTTTAPRHLLRHHQQDATESDPEDSTSASASASASAGEFVAADIEENLLIDDPDFHCLAEAASAISYPMQPIYARSHCAAAASAFRMREENESLFGELPECTLVFWLVNPVKPEETIGQCGMSTVPCVRQSR